jgi:type IV pilus assembly protein PilW
MAIRQNHCCCERNVERGFSLIEMMVVVLIGIILSIGLVQVMIAGKTASQATQGANFMQENARFATSQLDYSLQMADHWGATNPDKGKATAAAKTAFDNMLTAAGCSGLSTATYVTGQNWWTLGVYGIDNSSTPDSVLGTDCIPQYVIGTDVVVLRYADGGFIQCVDNSCATTSPAGAVSANGLYVRASLGKGMVLAKGSEITALAAGTLNAPLDANYFESPDNANQDGLYTFPYRLEIYYIRKCSTPTTAGVCNTASDNGSPIPTMWRRRVDNSGSLVLEPVVEGIEQFRLEYGLASDNVTSGAIPARFADIQTYKSASDVGTGTGATDWLKVVSVRVGIMAQGDSFNSSGTRGNVGERSLQGARNLGSDPGPGAAYTPADTLIQHSVYTTLGQVRNRDRG